jgi:RNA polymerase sigma-B factor
MLIVSAKKLTEDEIQDRLASYAERADPHIRDEIVLQYGNLVESIGRRFVGACEPLEDLCQEGYIGLIASVDKYDASKGVKFSTYATHFIIGQIKHYLRDKGKIIKEPAWLQELNQRMTRVIESLGQQLNRHPTEREIGDVMQMPERTVVELLTTREVFKVSSLDGDKDDSPNQRDPEKIKDDKVVTFQLPLEDKIVLGAAMQRLKDIEQQVISEHYYKGHNQTEIAKQLGISCNYVSHILRNGTKKLKKILATEEIRDTQMQRTLVSARPQASAAARESLSVIDGVTGVYNRYYMEQRLDEEVSRACRAHCKMSLVLVDICLPEDTERYLRMVRLDDVLYAAAQTIRASVRKMDVVARFGQTSFALILPHTSGNAAVVAERLAEIVSAIEIESGRKTAKIGAQARIGIAKYPADATNHRELLQKACEDMGVEMGELLGEAKQQLKKAA